MKNLYSQVGPDKLKLLVDRFYDLVFSSSVLSPLFQTEKSVIREKQYQFLSQFLGGPALYSEIYGHPRMRMRHLPHRIDQKAKEEWLKCMKAAIDSLELDVQVKTDLYNCFPQVAEHMVNS